MELNLAISKLENSIKELKDCGESPPIIERIEQYKKAIKILKQNNEKTT